jgi:hypothetical protein
MITGLRTDSKKNRLQEKTLIKSLIRETYFNTNVDFKRYNKLFLGESAFHYREVKSSRMTSGIYSNTSSGGAYAISEEDRKKFEEIVGEAFRQEIVKGKHFTVVDSANADENTIVMRGVVVDRVPPRSAGIVDTYMATVGEATLELDSALN